MIAGGCVFHETWALHNNYPDSVSQLQEALAFLSQHRNEVNPITLDIGANDILNLDTSCAGIATCILGGLSATIATMASNLNGILSDLVQADPSAEIIVTNVPDPYEFIEPASIPLFTAFNNVLDAVVQSNNDRLVDAFDAALPLSETRFCTLSNVCTPPLFDIHPTDAGYAVLAQEYFTASGYAALQH